VYSAIESSFPWNARAKQRANGNMLSRAADFKAVAIMGAPLVRPKEAAMTAIRERLVDDFVSVLSEAEELLKRAGNETGERARDLRAQVEAKLLAAKLRRRSSRARRSTARGKRRSTPTSTSMRIRGA
jgi:ElaB/YqjD/DUF883 family membrane-anchored ribosome-binding protein